MSDMTEDAKAALISKTGEILDGFDKAMEPISEAAIVDALRAVGRDVECKPLENVAELTAFALSENDEDRSDDWGTYYGPMSVLITNEGNRIEFPSISEVTPDILTYWIGRAETAKNPVLRARYADLCWDLYKPCTGKKPDYGMAQTAIDAIIEIAEQDRHEFKSHVKTKLARALTLAITINDKARVQRVAEAIIAYENRIAEDDAPGLFGFAYDILWNNKHVVLSDAHKSRLIADLEARLSRTEDPWAVEACATRLAKHYRTLGRTDDVRRVLKAYSAAVEKLSAHASPMQATMWLEQVYHVLAEFGLGDDADRIARRIRKLGSEVVKGMKTLMSSVSNDAADMEKSVEAIVEGSLKEAMTKIVLRFIPRKAQVSSLLDELKKTAPMTFLITTRIVDHMGRVVSSVGPLDVDRQGHLVLQMSRHLSFESQLLREVMSRFISKFMFTPSVLTDVLFESPVFEPGSRDVVQRGVEAYLEGDYLAAVHLLIPQIENAVRNLVEKSGGSVLRQNREGGFDLRLLRDLLSDPLVERALGQDASFYLRVALTDRRGWNLRNSTCHGLVRGTALGSDQADRVIHILLLLGMLRETTID